MHVYLGGVQNSLSYARTDRAMRALLRVDYEEDSHCGMGPCLPLVACSEMCVCVHAHACALACIYNK